MIGEMSGGSETCDNLKCYSDKFVDNERWIYRINNHVSVASSQPLEFVANCSAAIPHKQTLQSYCGYRWLRKPYARCLSLCATCSTSTKVKETQIQWFGFNSHEAIRHCQWRLAKHKAPSMPMSVNWNYTAFSLPHGPSCVSPKVELYTLFCSCLSMWRIISHLREWVSSKCSTLEHTERDRAKSKLCNWILRGWLGIADLAVIKTTLFTLVLHHNYSKTAD